MIETNIKNLTVEEIMQEIKREVEKRKRQNSDYIQNNPSSQRKEILLDKTFHNYIENQNNTIAPKDVYEYPDFTKYHDVEFIKNIYRALLKREVDNEGLNHYLGLLRSGKKSKSEIISLVRYSKEGRKGNVKLLGSMKRFILATLYNIPIIGYLSKLFVSFITLPKLVKRLNSYENYVSQEAIKSYHHDKLLEKAINLKADKTELEQIANELHVNLESKADKIELEQIANELHVNLESKADKIELALNDVYEEQPIPLLSKAIQCLNKPIDIISQVENRDDLYYLLFENVFYEHNNVKKKQKIYLKYINKINNNSLWLDVGSGRGEFLSILKENNIEAVGVEINKIEYTLLKERKYNVVLDDGVSYLKKINQKFMGISALQVVEHLETNNLKEMLILAYEKLEDNGIIILETINPRNTLGLSNFHMDETHKIPILPERLVFLLEWIGFKNIKIVYSARTFNNIKRISDNYHDYAVIGYKV